MRSTLAFAASLLLFVSACGKDSTGPGGTTQLSNGTFSGSVNNSPFVPLAVTVATNGGLTVFSAATASGQSFAFALLTTGAGPYTISSTTANNALYIEGQQQGMEWNAGAGVVGGSGTVTLTTVNATRHVGSFTVTLVADATTGATGTKTITGSFDIVPY